MPIEPKPELRYLIKNEFAMLMILKRMIMDRLTKQGDHIMFEKTPLQAKVLDDTPFIFPNTIFVSLAPGKLLDEIKKVAGEMELNIYTPKSDSEIYVAHFFVGVIDRRVFGMDNWEAYESYCEECENIGPIILVDDLPKTKYCVHHHHPIKDRVREGQVLDIVKLLYKLTNYWIG